MSERKDRANTRDSFHSFLLCRVTTPPHVGLRAYVEAASNVIPFASPPRSVFIRTPSSPLYLTVATLMEKMTGPLSTGSLRLASTDVRVNPIVRFHFFSNSVDIEKCVNGTRKIGDGAEEPVLE